MHSLCNLVPFRWQRFFMKALESVGNAIPVVMPTDEKHCDGVFLMGPAPPTDVPVRIIRKAEINPGRDRGALSEDEWDFLLGVVSLKSGVQHQDRLEIQKAYAKLSRHMMQELSGKAGEMPSDALMLYVNAVQNLKMLPDEVSRWVTEALKRVRLVYWLAGKPGTRAQPGIALFCPDFKTALAVKMLVSGAVRECAHCNSPFLAKRPKQQCCTPKCVSAHRYARWKDHHGNRRGKGEMK